MVAVGATAACRKCRIMLTNLQCTQSVFLPATTSLSEIDFFVVKPLHKKINVMVSYNRLTVWLSGNALASINVVVLRQTRLVPGWVIVRGRVNHLGM